MLRSLTPEDAATVQCWLQDHIKQHVTWWEKAYQIQARTRLQDLVLKDWQSLLEDSSKPDRMVLVFGEKPLGIVHGMLREDPYMGVSMGVLAWIYVDAAARGQGVADQLVEALMQWFREKGVEGRLVYVTASNTTAVKLYQRHGFEVIDYRMLGPV